MTKKLILTFVMLAMTIAAFAQEEAEIDPKTWEPDISMVDLEALRASGEINDYRLPHEGAEEKIIKQWIAAQMRQRTEAEKLGIPVEFTDQFGIEFVYVPSGEFVMGDDQEKRNPPHHVTISKGFYMSKCEIEQILYTRIMKRLPGEFDTEGMPAAPSSWYEGVDFYLRLMATHEHTEEEGLAHYRYPTEAEWEYACRAGTSSYYYWGNDTDAKVISKYAWYDERSFDFNDRQTIGQKHPNAYGLHDMIGNLYEFCLDTSWPLTSEATIDPIIAQSDRLTDEERSIRGGHYFQNDIRRLKSSSRSLWTWQDYYGGYQDWTGMRLILEIPDKD